MDRGDRRVTSPPDACTRLDPKMAIVGLYGDFLSSAAICASWVCVLAP